MIIGFKEQFKNKILSGEKIHTIREDKPNRWHIGRIIHMSTGVRTKKQLQFNEAVCTSIQKITIEWECNMLLLADRAVVRIDGKPYATYYPTNIVHEHGLLELALNDGFDNVRDFFKWFNSDFEGKIIHWTYFKYL